mmetsp:Transcript_81466/g.143872  ORF Transcript_81466/g.143872 Transcript_81466/m.143872 type:complete len:119 (-) Transcript_81466:59-415(-)|eukprot:CAMPEP_0197642806 /NCGR_PEP_ID=MMETSP1338-20131121/16352_1 /TAXON_ID=43686 ORGANISM="Pelagodinium beii, Strain RCC1491" /NCGR_SAMPLE_ID=MMETSP1338 /ASSEMBLY_ACC=CAM_ASM_000754 /LENGTH=118 /DNA_ID=CAMNT_0043215979 /DNA_START=55 /DNA_END=411 /DNA_ORIENTATION=-
MLAGRKVPLLLQLCVAAALAGHKPPAGNFSGQHTKNQNVSHRTEAGNFSRGETSVFCLAPLTSLSGYLIWEYHLEDPGFDVRARCADGYDGKAKVEPCNTFGGRYKVSGCQSEMSLMI